MYKRFVLCIISMCFWACTGFAQNWQWAKSATLSNVNAYSEGYSVATDANDNLYVTGIFQSSYAVFGIDTVINGGSGQNIYLAKYDKHGNVLWAKSAVGKGNDWGNCVAADNFGNVYITGFFTSDTLVFGTDTITCPATGGGNSLFYAKYDAAGNVLWAKGVACIPGGVIEGNSIAADIYGNIYITGRYSYATFGTYTLTSVAYEDVYLAKFNSSGNVLWAKSAGGTSEDVGTCVTTDNLGNVLVTGYFASPSFLIDTYTLTNLEAAPQTNIFYCQIRWKWKCNLG